MTTTAEQEQVNYIYILSNRGLCQNCKEEPCEKFPLKALNTAIDVFEKWDIDPSMFNDIEGSHLDMQLRKNPLIKRLDEILNKEADNEVVKIYVCPILEEKLKDNLETWSCIRKYFRKKFGLSLVKIEGAHNENCKKQAETNGGKMSNSMEELISQLSKISSESKAPITVVTGGTFSGTFGSFGGGGNNTITQNAEQHSIDNQTIEELLEKVIETIEYNSEISNDDKTKATDITNEFKQSLASIKNPKLESIAEWGEKLTKIGANVAKIVAPFFGV